MNTTTSRQTRILLIEDEKKLAQLLQKKLAKAEYDVDLAFSASEAEANLGTTEYHLLILDIGLPDKSGFEFLREFRGRKYETPILILSAYSNVTDRVQGLHLGADDYLVKPFDTTELLARIEAILRRTGEIRFSVLQAGDVTLDMAQRIATRSGIPVKLSPTEFSLLEFLIRNKNQVLSRKRIAEQVWGYSFDTGTNIVDVYISYLRDALDDHEKKLILTVYGQGFMLQDTQNQL